MMWGIVFGLYYNPKYDINRISEQRLEKINSTRITDSDSDIIMDQRVLDVLNIMFYSHTVEYMVCLNGIDFQNKTLINSITATRISYSDEKSLIHESCPMETKIMLHNHRGGACALSNQDIETFEKYIDEYNFSTEYKSAVQCGYNNIAIFEKGNYNKNLKWISTED